MTLRVGSSFNPAIEAQGFLACSFCCSKDEGASYPLLRAHLSGGASSSGCRWVLPLLLGYQGGLHHPTAPCFHSSPFACLQDLSVVEVFSPLLLF